MNDRFRTYRHHLYAGRKAPGTILQRIGDLERFERSTQILIEDASGEDLLQYMADHHHLWAPEYSKRIRASLRSYFQWRAAADPDATDESRNLPSVRIPKKRHRRPAADDLVLAAFDKASLRERTILALAAGMGLRRTEIATLPLLARQDRELTVLGKGQRERILELDDLTLHLLRSIEAESATGEVYYFPGRWSGTHLHPTTVYEYVKRMLPDESCHTLRHRAGTTGYRRTKDIRATQDFLGHSSLATTEIYVELDKRSTSAITRATSLANAGDSVPASSLESLLAEAADLSQKLLPYGWNVNLTNAALLSAATEKEVAG